ncbi:MAG: SMI1/KNR4 family protein [Moraxella sp.]|nr:SMI1/KNR4 family protein [Moraxella sp.]
MTIINDYLTGLKQAYNTIADPKSNYWQGFEHRIHGASDTDIIKLKEKFPLIPQSLIELLKFVDGTYCREYHGEQIAFYMFGSIPDEFVYPCYLNSCEQMLNGDDEFSYLKDYINRDIDPEWGISIDDKIIDDFDKVNWLHLSNCANNGGTSQLYIDFSPSDTGKMGQVVMFLHDPDELTVIADSFDEYLQLLMDSEFAFIDADMADEFYWD